MEVLLVLVSSAACMLCFLIGAKVGQAVTKGERVELPNMNPMQAVRDHRAKKQAQMEQDRLDTILRNIESYDGTSRGQEDVPGR